MTKLFVSMQQHLTNWSFVYAQLFYFDVAGSNVLIHAPVLHLMKEYRSGNKSHCTSSLFTFWTGMLTAEILAQAEEPCNCLPKVLFQAQMWRREICFVVKSPSSASLPFLAPLCAFVSFFGPRPCRYPRRYIQLWLHWNPVSFAQLNINNTNICQLLSFFFFHVNQICLC